VRPVDRAVPLPRTVKRARRRLDGLRFRKRGVVRNSVPLRLTRARTVNRPRESTRARVNRSGTLFVTTPRFRNLSPLSLSLGRFTVRGSASRVRGAPARALRE